MADTRDTLLLESYFQYFYAKDIISRMYTVFKENCIGCERGYLSQRDHECLSTTESEQLELYFDDILSMVKQEDVLKQWNQHVHLLNISSKLIDMYRQNNCFTNWRKIDTITVTWKKKMIRNVLNILQLERVFMS